MLRRRLGPKCSLLNNQTQMINSKRSRPSRPGHPGEPYRFCGTRGRCPLKDQQYWQVKIQVTPRNGFPLPVTKSFAEIGVASKEALSLASRIITPCRQLACTLKFGPYQRDRGQVVATLLHKNNCINFEDLESATDDGRLLWTCGFLVDTSRRVLMLLDITSRKLLHECQMEKGLLYPVFSVVYSLKGLGAHVSISVESNHALALPPEVLSLLRAATDRLKSLPCPANKGAYNLADENDPSDEEEDDGYNESENERGNADEGRNSDADNFSEELVYVASSEEDDDDEDDDDEEAERREHPGDPVDGGDGNDGEENAGDNDGEGAQAAKRGCSDESEVADKEGDGARESSPKRRKLDPQEKM